METKISTMRRSTRLAALTLLTVVGLLGATVAVQAFNPQPEPPARWVVGLTHDQTASLTAVNLGRDECVVGWSWLDETGATLAANEMRIAPGAFASDTWIPPEPVRPADDTAETPARFSVRGAVTPLTPHCVLATTLEVFDNADGKTRIAIGNAGR